MTTRHNYYYRRRMATRWTDKDSRIEAATKWLVGAVLVLLTCAGYWLLIIGGIAAGRVM